MKRIFRVVCTCCWNPQILLYVKVDGIPTALFLSKHKLEYFFDPLCSNKLKASGSCFREKLIMIPSNINFLTSRGGRFGNGFLWHESMEKMGFQWGQDGLYIPETWHSPMGKKMRGIYLM
ncbi:hypothetical protein D4R87_00560 [bacterium]|nr:MAG: hypothetical protein D4R87_00560 [bacterium]